MMDSTVDAMAAAYDALMDAATAAIREPAGGRAAALEEVKRCVEAFHESCDRAEGLVQAAAARLGHAPGGDGDTRIDALCRTVQAIEHGLNLQGAAADVRDENKESDEKDATPSPAPVTVTAEDDK